MNDVMFDRIRKDITTYDVVLYMKGTVAFPMDGFSAAMVQILTQLNIVFKDINVLNDSALHQALKTFASWPNTPQLYIKGVFIGGTDKVREMFATGALQDLLGAHQIARRKTS